MDCEVGEVEGRASGFVDLAARLVEQGLCRSGGAAGTAERSADLLCGWGAAVWRDEVFELVPPWGLQELRLFAPVLDRCRLKVIETTLTDAPVRMVAVLADTVSEGGTAGAGPPLRLVAGGQGLSKAEALLSAFGELAERLSLWSLGEQDPRIERDRKGRDLDLGSILGFSMRQRQELKRTYPVLVHPSGRDEPDWAGLCERRVCVRDLVSGEVVRLPSYALLMGEGQGLGLKGLSLASTIGAAVWTDLAGARSRALQELVERDAISQFWYNLLGITRLDRADWPDFIHRNSCDYLWGRERRTDFFQVATDLATHVVAAISRDREGYDACFGSAAAASLPEALSSALGELLQAEHAHALAMKLSRSHPAEGPSRTVPLTVPRLNIDRELRLTAVPSMAQARKARPFLPGDLLQSCKAGGLRIFGFEATRPDVRVPCMKLVSPDLCSPLPRFGKTRLFEGVVERGLRAQPLSENEMRLRPFPF